MSPDEALGKRITELREQRGLSKVRLAREAGVSDAYIVQIEQSQRTPSDDVLRRISAALGLHPLHLAIEFNRIGALVSDRTKYEIGQYADAVASSDPERIRNATLAVKAALDWDEIDETGNTPAWVYEMEGTLPVAPPEGWDRLDPNDRQLIQKLINRVLTGEDYD